MASAAIASLAAAAFCALRHTCEGCRGRVRDEVRKIDKTLRFRRAEYGKPDVYCIPGQQAAVGALQSSNVVVCMEVALQVDGGMCQGAMTN